MKRSAIVTFAVLVFALAGCREARPSAVKPAAGVVTIEQSSNRATVQIEIAATFATRQQGLMFRQELAESAGMLFLFNADVEHGFWMKNTYLPLDIAYISSAGEVLEIRAAKPLDETVLTPAQPYRYVLEVNQGWFERHSLGTGAKVTVPENLPSAE